MNDDPAYFYLNLLRKLTAILGITFNDTSSDVPMFSAAGSSAAEANKCDGDGDFELTLEEEYTQSIGEMLKDSPIDKFEASDVVYDESRDAYWVVFDDLWSIAMLTTDETRKDVNKIIDPTENNNDDDSGFEGITRDESTDTFYIVTESVEFSDNDGKDVYHPVIRSVSYDGGSTYTVDRICAVDFEAPTDNKGFEGLQLVEVDGQKYFVGLCEGNHCSSGKEGKDKGNGQIALIKSSPKQIDDDANYQYLVDADISCSYTTLEIVNLPPEAQFIDYSALEFRQHDGNFDVVVVSQSSAAIWKGTAEWTQQDGLTFEKGSVYQFPKTNDCDTQFCNVEGVSMLNDDELVMVSDKAKKSEKSSCGAKAQSIHIFKI